MFSKKKVFEFIFPTLIFFSAFLVWLPILGVPFLNDDFQIIGWHNPHSFYDCFKPLWTTDVSIYYWRPFVNIIHSLTIYIFGFTPFAFRFENLFFYSSLCISVAYFFRKIGLNYFPAITAGIFFSILPVHEIHIGWIAARGDILAALFIVLSSCFYLHGIQNSAKKYYYFSLLMYIAAALSKEIAFVGILLPFIFIFIDSTDKKSIITAIKAAAAALVITAVIIIYRLIVIGGTPFDSPNLASFSFLSSIFNFFIYLVVSVLPPDIIEYFTIYFIHNIGYTILISVCIIILGYFVIKPIKINKNSLKIIIVGALWFIVFIIPGIPLFMRWYALVPSIGLIAAIGGIFNEKPERYTKILISSLLMITLIVFISYDNRKLIDWKFTAYKTNKILDSFIKYKNVKEKYFILWGTPDKIERVNALKIGIEKAVQFKTANFKLDVQSPLRVECHKNSKFKYTKISDNEFILTAINARFLPVGERSRAVIINEKYVINNADYNFSILTKVNSAGIISTTIVKIPKPLDSTINLYFDGNGFKEL